MSTRVDDIVADVITELSQVPGVATQLYSSDRIRQYVQDSWLLEIEAIWWPQYMMWFNVALDGVTGIPTTDLTGPISSIDDYGDIQLVFPIGSNKRLRELPPGMNPYLMSGGATRYVSADATVPHRPLRVWPQSATGNIAIRARQNEAIPFTSTSTVLLDRLLLTYDAAWMYTVDDGTVPQQVMKYQQLATKRRQQMIASANQQPLELDPRFPGWEMNIEQEQMFPNIIVLDTTPVLG
jgi:hypothetical protein